MRIGIDYRLATEIRPRGIGRYIFNLVPQLVKLGKDHEFVLYAHRLQNLGQLTEATNVRVKILRPGFYPFWEQCLLPLWACIDKVDLLHCTSSTGPLFLPKQVGYVVTVHDVSFMMPTIVMPRPRLLYQKMGRLYRTIVVPRVIRRAKCMIAVSRHTQAEIVHMTGVDPLKAHVVYHGLTLPISRGEAQISESELVHSLPARYILCIGGDAPHKNVERAIRVFSKIVSCGHNEGHSLVVLGVQQGKRSPFWEEVINLKLQSSVKFIEFVTDNVALIELYRRALFVLIPSLNESFGMPALEAMSCGVPVVTSSVAAIPEIVGNAALLIDPQSDDSIEQGMRTMLKDKAIRERFVYLGHQRVGCFSWEKAARETLCIYEKAAKK